MHERRASRRAGVGIPDLDFAIARGRDHELAVRTETNPSNSASPRDGADRQRPVPEAQQAQCIRLDRQLLRVESQRAGKVRQRFGGQIVFDEILRLLEV